MSDQTETIRRSMVQQINTVPGDRERLEAKHGKVWDTQQLQQDFEVLGFAAPLIVVRERRSGQKGSLFFQHSPRLYWGFTPDESGARRPPEQRRHRPARVAKNETEKL
jgi:hypothetical protein